MRHRDWRPSLLLPLVRVQVIGTQDLLDQLRAGELSKPAEPEGPLRRHADTPHARIVVQRKGVFGDAPRPTHLVSHPLLVEMAHEGNSLCVVHPVGAFFVNVPVPSEAIG